LLALASINEDTCYHQILSDMEHIVDYIENYTTDLDMTMYLWLLTRMAFAAQLKGDVAKSTQLQAYLSERINSALNQNPMSTWTIAYLASLGVHHYKKYQHLLKTQTQLIQIAFQKNPVKEINNYLWTLTMNLYAAANAGAIDDYDTYLEALKKVTSENTLQAAINKQPISYPQWLISMLRQATFRMQDISSFVSLSCLIQVDLDLPTKVDNLDSMLAMANHLLVLDAIENHAAKRLAQRPAHILSSQKLVQDRVFSLQDYKKTPNSKSDLKEQIVWQSYFQPVAAFHVMPKQKHLPTKPVWIYAHWDSNFPQNEGIVFTAHTNDTTSSIAKISIHPEQCKYPDGSVGCMYVDIVAANESENDYRLGSLMMEVAIRYSFNTGYEGKIQLMSANDSGLFYWGLGFVPLNETVYLDLFKRKAVDGSKMYLPQASCLLWKEKINEHQNPIQQIRPQTTEKIIIKKSPKREWLHLLNRLQYHAVSELIFDHSMIYLPKIFENLIFALKYNCSLRSVSFNSAFFNQTPLSRLLSSLVLHPSLEMLIIDNDNGIRFNASSMSALADVLYSAPQLKILRLANLHITSENFREVASALSSSTLEILYLDSVTFSENNLTLFREAIKGNTHLRVIQRPEPIDATDLAKSGETVSLAHAARKHGVFQERIIPSASPNLLALTI
jgi:hypothetical protein